MATEDPQRSSAGSGRASAGRSSRQNPQQQLSTIEKSVTHLLVATKQLLETLTMWSRATSTESEVSDVYVRLGYEFNIACRAFNAIGVETDDLGPVPDLLRAILEDTLSQEASQASLDRYLPRIRDIIINLLHGLKKKQQRLRQKNGGAIGDKPPRQASTASNASVESSLTAQLEDVPSRHSSGRSFAQRQGSGELGGPDLPPRTTSASAGRSSPRRSNLSPQNSMHQATSRETMGSDFGSSRSSTAMQHIPTMPPYPEQDTIPMNQGYEPDQASPEPPRPPPKQNDALTALQRGGDLERRASRRFSAYQIHKHLGGTMNGIGTIPPAQHSPLPNRGRDVRESMSAVRSRASVHNRARSRHDRTAGGHEPSPNRVHDVRKISEEPSELAAEPTPPPPPSKSLAEEEEPDSPTVKTPEDKLGEYPFPIAEQVRENVGATLNGPIEDVVMPGEDAITPVEPRRHDTLTRGGTRAVRYDTPPQSQYIPNADSPQAGKELTLFLQYKSKIKKYVLDGGELSVPRLQLAFIEKFAWNTQNNGVDLPEIYIQDPVSGVRYELDGLNDVKDRSVLVLNVEALDEVKRHIDDGIGGLRRIVEGIKVGVEEQGGALRLVSERQQETAKELAGMAAATPPRSASGIHSRNVSSSVKGPSATQLEEVRTLRRDLAVVRQTYAAFVADVNASMTTIRSKATSVKQAATTTTTSASKPDDPPATTAAGRTHITAGKITLSTSSEKIVNRVDDLQDTVEDLRKDVVLRGVRPLPRQLEVVSKDISLATAQLKKLQEFLKREKPVWTRIWEGELQVVCDERELLTMQEELVMDLEDDLEKAARTFELVEQATRQQNLGGGPGGQEGGGGVRSGSGQGGLRSNSRTLRPAGQIALSSAGANGDGSGGGDPQKAHDGVLGEVRALRPNHESRLEAIERAEKLRQKELESRKGGEFERELGGFVEEGRLKKSGGVEEVERLRRAREEKSRREVWERTQARLRGGEAAAAVAETNGTAGGGEAAAAGGLEVPGGVAKYEGERESSPEPVFVEAKEEAGSGDSSSVGT
ncbi:Bud site selection protein 6 [Friedmanniomyces endolithicus]|uniref:Bud site selection protein 6 n=1 Tax=Friedmanniomyces endolithicus TaxID=329885 RepID=A0A4U0VHG0_9PEZI|nr:Bud site selection protein 6 [Friedmanniomyces endolithicus]KAK0363693.1 Bud site selection protein 6 [Friedmanniomyces endolithicus]KAK0806564.1 Bud site selection protein 6 [Friedmanniomyces endolithicus]KAK0817177.1 Bud site selection protein 6 [Friedmanniomyces endolithicus]KAK0837989.1 Bud site selection protein 6 [Friedmanniomyces endolithicus]